MSRILDAFNDDAFSLTEMVAAINNIDHVPGRAGELAFAGVGKGVSTTDVAIESKASVLTLIQTSNRGAPAPKETADKANIRNVEIPQIKLEDTIQAHSIQDVREFGGSESVGPEQVRNERLAKMAARHDLTLEHHRLGALQGKILDADATVLTDLFTLFSVTNDNSATGGGGSEALPKAFDFGNSSSSGDEVRIMCMEVTRFMQRVVKLPSAKAGYHAFCGDEFFDSLISRADVKAAYETSGEQVRRLSGDYAFGTFEFGGIVFENYRGTDDNSTVAIASDEARVFMTGVPGLYAEYFAPADFLETVNTIGLPRYAKAAPDGRFNQSLELHTQQNPLPLCLRPQTLCKLFLS